MCPRSMREIVDAETRAAVGEVRLPPSPPNSNRPYGRTHPLIVHVGSLATTTYRGLTEGLSSPPRRRSGYRDRQPRRAASTSAVRPPTSARLRRPDRPRRRSSGRARPPRPRPASFQRAQVSRGCVSHGSPSRASLPSQSPPWKPTNTRWSSRRRPVASSDSRYCGRFFSKFSVNALQPSPIRPANRAPAAVSPPTMIGGGGAAPGTPRPP